MKKKIVIFGDGQIAQIAHFYLHNDSDFRVAAFTVDDKYFKKNSFLKLPLIPFSKIKKSFPPEKYLMYVALSYKRFNRLRAEKYLEAKKMGYKFITYINSKVTTWPDLKVGENTFIFENNVIQPGVKIGNNVIIWSGNHLGHDSIIHDNCFISSHVVISGNVEVGSYSFLGVNSAVRDGIKLGKETFASMGANIVKATKDGDVVLPAYGTVFDKNSEQAKKIRKNFFSL